MAENKKKQEEFVNRMRELAVARQAEAKKQQPKNQEKGSAGETSN
jgi:hypothetical protein